MGETLFVDEVPMVRHRLIRIARGLTLSSFVSMISITGYTVYQEGVSADRWLLQYVQKEAAYRQYQQVDEHARVPSVSVFSTNAYKERTSVWSKGIIVSGSHQVDRLYGPELLFARDN